MTGIREDPAADDADDADETVEADRTVVGSRQRQGAPADDDTRAVTDDATIASMSDASAVGRRPRRIRSALLPPGVLRAPQASRTATVTLPEWIDPAPEARDGAGPGAVTAYAPRSIPAPPQSEPLPPSSDEPTRADAPHMPSVRRASKRRSRVVLAAVTLACALSVAGLWLVALVAIAG